MIALLALMLVWLAPAPAVHYCPHPVRHPSAVVRFHRSTGYPHGRAGYVVDHVVPLCACGKDAPTNMQWQRLDSSLVKDRAERRQCAALRKAAQ